MIALRNAFCPTVLVMCNCYKLSVLDDIRMFSISQRCHKTVVMTIYSHCLLCPFFNFWFASLELLHIIYSKLKLMHFHLHFSQQIPKELIIRPKVYWHSVTLGMASWSLHKLPIYLHNIIAKRPIYKKPGSNPSIIRRPFHIIRWLGYWGAAGERGWFEFKRKWWRWIFATAQHPRSIIMASAAHCVSRWVRRARWCCTRAASGGAISKSTSEHYECNCTPIRQSISVHTITSISHCI